MPSFFSGFSQARGGRALVSTNLSAVGGGHAAGRARSAAVEKHFERCLEFILKWNWHLGQTKDWLRGPCGRLMAAQDSHLTTAFWYARARSSGGVDCFDRFFVALKPSHR